MRALGRGHPMVAPGPRSPSACGVQVRLRRGADLFPAGDVYHAELFDRIEQAIGIVPLGRLVD